VSGVKECCQQQKNLKPEKDEKGRTFERCIVCKCRHFSMVADAGRLFTHGASIARG